MAAVVAVAAPPADGLDEEPIMGGKTDPEGLYRSWDLQFVTPPERRSGDPAERVPDYIGGEEDEKYRPLGPALGWPAEGEDRWGRFEFRPGSGREWNILSPSACGRIVHMPRSLEPPGDTNLFRAVWLRRSQKIESHRLGRRVFLHLDGVRGCDCVVFVNRRRVGAVYRGAGDVEITNRVRFGFENEFLIFASSTGWNLPATRKMPDGAEAPNRYDPSAGLGRFLFTGPVPSIRYKTQLFAHDTFANTSWQTKRLIVETFISSPSLQKGSLLMEVKDRDGKVVLRDTVTLRLERGENKVSHPIPWKNPTTWELGRGYMYTLCLTVMDMSGAKFPQKPVRFGFREIWRDGRRIMMNGHVQCFRAVHGHGANAYGCEFLSRMGFNTIQMSGVDRKSPVINEETLEWLSEHGMAAVIPTSVIRFGEQEELWKDPARAASYEATLADNVRRYRNWPCVAMCYFATTNISPAWSAQPQWTASGGGDGYRSKLADRTAEIGRKYNPNVLFMSLGDGSCGDVNSLDLFLGFTPLQERETWMCRWSERGRAPFQASEFGSACRDGWYAGGAGFTGSERLAAYFGEEAYAVPRALDAKLRTGIGLERIQFPFYWALQTNLVASANRGWRTAGVNGGWVAFDDDTAFGMPDWRWDGGFSDPGRTYSVSYQFTNAVPADPDWLWPSYGIHSIANRDFLGYIGGIRYPGGKTHGYFSGDTMKKCIVMRWDGFRTSTFRCRWTATVGGSNVGGGDVGAELRCAETKGLAISFGLPKLPERASGEISAEFFDSKGRKIGSDTFAFEVHPRYARKWDRLPDIGLYDPVGRSEAILKALGIPRYRRLSSLEDGKSLPRLIVGKDALDYGAFNVDRNAVRTGQRILYLPQSAHGWSSLGFEGEGTMSRRLYLRDRGNRFLGGLKPEDLHDWLGAPHCEAMKGMWHEIGYGPVRPKSTPRGPRWIYDMAIAAQTLNTPNAVGFVPQVDGEFDLAYSGLMKFLCGRGSVTMCTLEFERCIGRDAAATAVADAVMRDFLYGEEAPHDRGLYTLDAKTRSIADRLGVPVREYVHGKKAPSRSVILCGPETRLSYEGACRLNQRGISVVFLGNEGAMAGAGLTSASTKDMFRDDPALKGLKDGKMRERIASGLYRVPYNPDNPLLRGMSAAHFHWRDPLQARVFTKSDKGLSIDCGGLLAYRRTGSAYLVFCLIDPEEIERRGAKGAEFEAIRLSTTRMFQFWARLLTNLEVDPGDEVLGRITWAKGGAKPRHRPCPVAAVAVPVPRIIEKMPECHEAALAGNVRNEQLATDRHGETKATYWSETAYRPDGDGNLDISDVAIPKGAAGVWLYTVYRIGGDMGEEHTLAISGGGEVEVYLGGRRMLPSNGGGAWKLVLPKAGTTPLVVIWKNPKARANITLAHTKDGKIEEDGAMPPGADKVNLLGGFFTPDPYAFAPAPVD